MIFNLGMSLAFGEVDVDNLPFPSYMMVDNIRVYQRPQSVNVGCNPPDYPTEQWIACHRENYIVNKADDILIPATCASGAERRAAGAALLAAAAVVAITLLLG